MSMARPVDLSKEDSYTTPTLDPKEHPNRLNMDSVDNGNSNGVVVASHRNMNELELFLGDTVMLKGCAGGAIKHEQEEISYDHIRGLQKQLAQMKRLVALPLKHPQVPQSSIIEPPRGLLLYGPSSTGKSLVARAVANETSAFFTVIDGPKMMSKEVDQRESDLRQAFEEARKKSPSIIFIRQLNSIAPQDQVKQSLAPQLSRLMDDLKQSYHVIVMGSTHRLNSIDPNLRRRGRFDRQIYFGIPNTVARLEIIRMHTKNISLSDDVDLMEIANVTEGYVGADLVSLCSAAVSQRMRENTDSTDLKADQSDPTLILSQDNFRFALNQTCASALGEPVFEIPRITWKDIAGIENIRCQSQELIQASEESMKFSISPSRSVILYGPPGCGKTLLAKAIANECQANFIWIPVYEFWRMHSGGSEDNDILDKACQSTPCILFLDQVHSITERQDDRKDEILTEIDRLNKMENVMLIGETNRPEMIDSNLLQTGRFDRLIYVPLPDEKSRLDIIKLVLAKSPRGEDVNIPLLAKVTNGFSGSDLTEICQRAAKLAIRQSIENDIEVQLGQQHFEEAMKYARFSITENDIAKHEAFARAHQPDAFHSRSS